MRKAILIYGASSDLSKGLDVALLSRGYDVGLSANSRVGELEGRAKALQVEFPKARIAVLQLDATDPAASDRSAAYFQAQFDQVAGFINYVGKFHFGPLSVLSDEDWNSCLDLNLNFNMRLIRAWLPIFSKQRFGRMALVSSLAARGARNLGAYGVSKSALAALARVTALEYASRGITCNVIEPGIFNTPSVRHWMDEQALKDWADRSPSKRLGEVEELTELATFLLTSQGAYLNGSVIPIAGGAGQV